MSAASLQEHFAELADPRRREVIHPLINVVVIAVCAVICGADDFVAIAKWGRTKRDWLAKSLDLSAGIPSHDRFNAILAALKPAEAEACGVREVSVELDHGAARKSPADRSSPSTARRSGAASTRPAASRRFTWSALGPRRTTSAWDKW